MSAFAAKIKSLSVNPSILWVQIVNLTFPHVRKISGWWPWFSASSPTLMVKSRASLKFLNEYSFSRWCSLIIYQSFFNFSINSSSLVPFNGETPPLQGIQVFFAKLLIIKYLFNIWLVIIPLNRRMGNVSKSITDSNQNAI